MVGSKKLRDLVKRKKRVDENNVLWCSLSSCQKWCRCSRALNENVAEEVVPIRFVISDPECYEENE